LVGGYLKLVGFPSVWTRRLLFKTLDFRNLIDKKLRAAKTAKVTSVIVRAPAILTLYHTNIFQLPNKIFPKRFYDTLSKKFSKRANYYQNLRAAQI